MRRAALLIGLAAWGTAALAAEDIEPVDADFLEYLGTLEADEGNWTFLEELDRKPKAAASSPKASTQAPPSKTEPRKATKEAVKPAAEPR